MTCILDWILQKQSNLTIIMFFRKSTLTSDWKPNSSRFDPVPMRTHKAALRTSETQYLMNIYHISGISSRRWKNHWGGKWRPSSLVAPKNVDEYSRSLLGPPDFCSGITNRRLAEGSVAIITQGCI